MWDEIEMSERCLCGAVQLTWSEHDLAWPLCGHPGEKENDAGGRRKSQKERTERHFQRLV